MHPLLSRDLTPEQLREIAQKNLSHFGGTPPQTQTSYTTMNPNPMYDGTSDALLSFAERDNFATQRFSEARQLSITIYNPDTIVRRLKLFAGQDLGDYTAMPHQLGDGLITPFLITGETLATFETGGTKADKKLSIDRNDGGSITAVLKKIRTNPIYLIGIKIQSSTDGQIAKQIQYTELDVWKSDSTINLKPANSVDQGTINTNIALAKINKVISNEIEMSYDIMGGATVVLDFFFGVEVSNHNYLKMTALAAENMMLAGNAQAMVIQGIQRENEQTAKFLG